MGKDGILALRGPSGWKWCLLVETAESGFHRNLEKDREGGER